MLFRSPKASDHEIVYQGHEALDKLLEHHRNGYRQHFTIEGRRTEQGSLIL